MQAWIDIVEKNICYKSLKNSMKIFRIINIFRYFVTMMGIMYIEIRQETIDSSQRISRSNN